MWPDSHSVDTCKVFRQCGPADEWQVVMGFHIVCHKTCSCDLVGCLQVGHGQGEVDGGVVAQLRMRRRHGGLLVMHGSYTDET